MSDEEPVEEGEGKGEEIDEIEQLRGELSKKEDMYLRTLADFENYRKRVERDQERVNAEKERIVLLELLEVIDSFEKALFSFLDDKNLGESILPVYNQILGVLERRGIIPFESIGESFDPKFHEAILATQSDKYPSGTIIGEMQKGYKIGDEVFRLARVQVVRDD